MNWRKIALQCVGFCCTTMWISCMDIPSLVSLSPRPYLTHLSHHRAPGWAPCVTDNFSELTAPHMTVCLCWRHFSPFVPEANPLQPPDSGSEKLGREKLGWAAAFFKQLWRSVSKTSRDEPERLLFRCFKKFIFLLFALNPHITCVQFMR